MPVTRILLHGERDIAILIECGRMLVDGAVRHFVQVRPLDQQRTGAVVAGVERGAAGRTRGKDGANQQVCYFVVP